MRKKRFFLTQMMVLIGVIACKEEPQEIQQEPIKTDFFASDTIINLHEEVSFTDLSTGNPTTWKWEFEGGKPNVSTGQNPKILYESTGIYSVKLISQNSLSTDSNFKKEYIIVENSTPINFELTWQKSIGEFNLSESVNSFIKTSDGGYMSSGSIWISNENIDVCIVKYNHNLEVVWEKIFTGNFAERGSSLIETSDGKFIVAGSTNSTEGQIKSFNGSYDIFLLKFDNNGEIVWQKSYGGSEYEGCGNNSLIELSNGNFMISGTCESNNGDVSKNIGGKDFWLVNLNNDGTIKWEKSFGGSQDEFSRQIFINNEALIVGLKSHSSDGDFSSAGNIVAKLSLDGEIIWVTNLSGMNYGKTIVDKNGGYISLIGNNENYSDFEVIKIDDLGSVLWKTSFGGSKQEYGTDLIQLNDNSLIMLGLSSSNDGEIIHNYGLSDDIIVAKLSLTGKLLGVKNFGGSNREWADCLLDLGNGEYIVNASTSSDDVDVINNFGATGIDNWIIKITESTPNN